MGNEMERKVHWPFKITIFRIWIYERCRDMMNNNGCTIGDDLLRDARFFDENYRIIDSRRS